MVVRREKKSGQEMRRDMDGDCGGALRRGCGGGCTGRGGAQGMKLLEVLEA